MNQNKKSTDQLLNEIEQLKLRVSELEAEKKLASSRKESYQSIFDGAQDGIIYVDKNLVALNVNSAFTEITGIPKDKVIGKSGFELAKTFVDFRRLPGILKVIKEAITGKPFKTYELDFKSKVLEISSRASENGGHVGVIRDITNRRQAEDRLKIIFEKAPIAIFLGGLDGTVLDGNKAAEEILGYKTKDVKGSNIFKLEFTDTSNFPKITKALAKSILGKKTGPEVYIAKRKDGTKVFVEISTYPVKIDNKSVVLGIGQDITKRIKVEKSLRESEEKYRSLFEQSADALLIIEDNMFVDCNPSTIKMLGYSSKEEFLDTHPSKLSPELQSDGRNSFEKANEMMDIAYARGNHRFEWHHKRKNGEVFPVEVLLTAVPIGNEKFLHVVWRDITDRKQAEEALVKSEQQYRNFFEKDISGVFLSTPKGKIIDFNPAFAQMFGYSSTEILDMNTTKLYPNPSDRKQFLKLLKKNKILINLELDLVKKDGQVIHCIENVVGDFNDKGELVQFQGYLINITERKLAEEELKNSEERLKIIFDAAPYAIFLKDKHGILIDGNKAAEDLIGQKKNKLIGKNVSSLNFSSGADKLKLGKTVAKILMGRITGPDEFVLNHTDGRQKLVESTTFPIKIKNKSVVLGFARDITERKNFEKALQEQVARNELMINTMMDGYILADTDGNILDVNTSYCEMVQYSRSELLTMNVHELEAHLNSEEIDQRIQIMVRDGKDQFESKHKCKDGSTKDFEVSIVIVQQADLRLVAAFVRDITERKKTAESIKNSEYLLRESQKVSNLGSYVLNIPNAEWHGSETLYHLFGIDENYKTDIEGWLKIVHNDDRTMMQEYLMNNVLEKHEAFNKEYRIVRVDNNQQRWVLGMGELEFSEDGKPIKMIGTIQDITDRKLISDALLESETKYRSLIENSNDAIYLLFNNRFEVINNKFTELLGYTLEEINSTGFSYANLVSPRSMQTFDNRQNQYKAGNLGGNKYEIVLVNKKGEEIEVEISDSFIDFKDGKANQGIIRDISARKKQQEILMNAILKVQEDEKYKFGKELHDGLGQVLISASMYLESLRMSKNTLPEDKQNDLEQAAKLYKQAITDARRISHGLMITGIDEHGLVYLIKQLCYNMSMPELTFKCQSNNIDETRINTETKVHLYRICQELSANILKHSNATRADIALKTLEMGYLNLVVSDNGDGFNPAVKNDGAGLQNVSQRVTILKGDIELKSDKKNGTKFTISIPL